MTDRKRTAARCSHEQSDRIAFFEAVHDGFRRAESSAGGCREHFYRIGGETVVLRFAGPGLIPHLTPAIAHLLTDSLAASVLTVNLWDSVSSGAPLPFLVAKFVQLLQTRWWEMLDLRREIKFLHGDPIRTTFHLGPDILSLFDTRRNLALYWVEDASRIPYYEKGYPMTSILSWGLEGKGLHFVHAAAVGTPAGGVLMAGKGGVGKSTTSLACVDSPLQFLSDDYCLLSTDGAPRAYSIYNSVKLKADEDVERFPHLKGMVSNPVRVGEEKAMIFLHQHLPQKLIRSFPIKAVLLPRITGQRDTRLREARGGEALRLLAPSTVFQVSGAGEGAFRSMVRLVKQVPSYTLELGTDISGIPRVIADLLHSLQG
jgi:hypothetical protein